MYEGPVTEWDPVDPDQVYLKTGAISSMYVDSWNVTVAQMLDTQNGPLCYTYTSSKSDIAMPAITCPPFNGVADPGQNPDPTLFGASKAVTTSAGSAQATNGASASSPLDDFLKSVVGMAVNAAKGSSGSSNVIVFGRDEIITDASEAVNSTVSSTTIGSDSDGVTVTVDSAPSSSVATATGTLSASTLNDTVSSTSTLVSGNITTSGNATVSASVHTVPINGTSPASATVATASTNIATSTSTSQYTPTPTPPHFEVAFTENNTTVVTFLKVNQTIELPETNTIRHVFQSYVETYDENNEIQRYYLPTERVPYKRVAGAPQNVKPGHPCYKMHIAPVSEHWFKHHKLNLVKAQNTVDRTNERIDLDNIRRCGPVKDEARDKNHQ
ncbi:hypothetical protein BCR33DRAFT_182039 [Rhizoclosmatium globosum]|uniref:Uncharacterized protein n=1 Tax=Rhizoclosmatium globosum TaxID=329046 RepID=A0A1Y2D0X7_9FUNG|nr:hypothetical protein BCR33DRAFT_182039 [Rhizoclosmatium globosum]|eukprot:ORY52943.1 hypothetical protein BCR33DRAFT_182039 [Rhizoclosmatium globosum]